MKKSQSKGFLKNTLQIESFKSLDAHNNLLEIQQRYFTKQNSSYD